VVDTDAPATLGSGLTAAIKTTSDVTVPEAVADNLRLLNVSYVTGTATATGTVDGVNRQTTLSIPNTPVPPDGTTMHVIGTGPSGSITAGAVGSKILLGAGNFTATFTGYSSVGTPFPPYTFTCTLQPSQDLLVDTVNVVPAATATTLTVQNSPVPFGARPVVLAEVETPGLNTPPSGTVEFTFQGASVKVAVKGGKAKATLAPVQKMTGEVVTATFTPASASRAPSQASQGVKVVRDDTTTTAKGVYRPGTHRFVAKAHVEAKHGTDASGNVRFVLRRDGVRIRTRVVPLNANDSARKVFRHVGHGHTYRLVARYLGSDTLRRSVDRVKVVV
jgi:hypothetical protein